MWILKEYCSATLLAAAGIIPVAGEAGVAACAGVAAAAAISSFIVGTAGTASWYYNSGSSTVSNAKRDFFDNTFRLNGSAMWYHVSSDIHDEFDDMVQNLAPASGHRLWHVGKLSNGTLTGDDTYNFLSATQFGNVSVVADKPGIMAALRLHESCHTDGACTLDELDWFKRDGANFVSYTDWGTNGGYDQDYVDWDYSYLTEHDYASSIGGAMIDQIQGCTERECYGTAQKICLSVGYSPIRGVESVAVGEVYQNSYGGVDSECYDG